MPVSERRYLSHQGKTVIVETEGSLLRNDAGQPVSFVVSFRDITENRRLHALLEEHRTIDPQTGALNRKQIEKIVRSEMARSDRYGVKFSLVMIGLDNLKDMNRAQGIEAGDRVLREFYDLSRSCHRVTDQFGRWGGDVFVALLPETSLTGAHFFAERLRSTVQDFSFESGARVTVSVGVVGYREREDISSLMERAKAALSLAKQNGRNQVFDDKNDLERELAGMLSYPQLVNMHWRASYLSGEALIDAEHQELFRLTNLVIGAIAEEGAGQALLPLVRELIAHVRTHFLHEEEILQAAGYSGADRHGRVHGRLLDRATSLADQFESGEGSAADLLGFLIHDVVVRHVLEEDRKYFPWLKKAMQG
jgi:diguanylate cyclase (GGDEF)-like protein/hemerythrin-like metal-binding protein